MNSIPTPQLPKFIHQEITQISGCPCTPSAAYGVVSIRAVHADIQHPDNFKPKAILEPYLLKGATAKKACGLWGVSMFDTPDDLRSMVSRVEVTVPGFRKKIGFNYAEMALSTSHGTRTPSNKSGHFNFYAYQTCNYHEQVVAVQVI